MNRKSTPHVMFFVYQNKIYILTIIFLRFMYGLVKCNYLLTLGESVKRKHRIRRIKRSTDKRSYWCLIVENPLHFLFTIIQEAFKTVLIPPRAPFYYGIPFGWIHVKRMELICQDCLPQSRIFFDFLSFHKNLYILSLTCDVLWLMYSKNQLT